MKYEIRLITENKEGLVKGLITDKTNKVLGGSDGATGVWKANVINGKPFDFQCDIADGYKYYKSLRNAVARFLKKA